MNSFFVKTNVFFKIIFLLIQGLNNEKSIGFFFSPVWKTREKTIFVLPAEFKLKGEYFHNKKMSPRTGGQ